MAPVTSQLYNIKDSMSLMIETPHTHTRTHTEQERCVWFHKKDISQVAVIVRRW